MVQFGIAVASACLGLVASLTTGNVHPRHDQPFACDTTSDQRDQIRAQVLTEVEKHGFVSANRHSVALFGGDAIGKPSTGLAYVMDPDAPSMSYQMHSPKDAIVWIGCSPPRGAWYFGCTHYLNTFGRSPRHFPFASMGDNLNQLNMRTTGEDFWESTFVVITAADNQSAAVVRAALEQHAPTLTRSINIQVIPSLISSEIDFEIGRDGASFSAGCRLAPGSVSDWDPSAQDVAAAYMAHAEPLLVLDGSQRQTAQPFATPLLRPRASGDGVELELQGTFEQLVCRIKQRAFDLGFVQTSHNSQINFEPLTPLGKDFYLNGTNCIIEGGNCLQDSPDALYMHGSVGAASLQVVVGVNHRLTGTAAYGYVQVRGGNTFFVHDSRSEGSAMPWANDLPEANLFTALTIVQDEEACDGFPADFRAWCFHVSQNQNPHVNYDERAYLSPVTTTGPDVDELLPTTALRFESRQSRHNERPVCSSPIV